MLAVYMEADIDTTPHHVAGATRIPIYPFPEPAAGARPRFDMPNGAPAHRVR